MTGQAKRWKVISVVLDWPERWSETDEMYRSDSFIPTHDSLGEKEKHLFVPIKNKLFNPAFSFPLLLNCLIFMKRSLRKREAERRWQHRKKSLRKSLQEKSHIHHGSRPPLLISLSVPFSTWSRNNGHFLLLSLETGSWNDRVNNHERERERERLFCKERNKRP